MKTKKILAIMASMLFTVSVFAASEKTEKITVDGKDENCKTKIEAAAKSVEGVSEANWDSATKELNVSYDDSKTNTEAILKAVSDKGYKAECNKKAECCKAKKSECKDAKASTKPCCSKAKSDTCSSKK